MCCRAGRGATSGAPPAQLPPFDQENLFPSQLIHTGGFDPDGNLVPLTIPLEYRPPVHATNVVVKAVCSDCNNGWMSKLEIKARPILLRFQSDDTVTLVPDEAATVVRWAQKTSTMLDRWSTGPRAYPAEVFKAIHENKSPSGNWHIRLAHAAEQAEVSFSHSPLMSDEVPHGSNQRTGYLVGVQSMMSIGRLHLMVRFSPFGFDATTALDGDFRGLDSASPVLYGDGATLSFEPALWPTYDFDVWHIWDLWQPFEGPGVVGLIEGPGGELVVTNLSELTPNRPVTMPHAWVAIDNAD